MTHTYINAKDYGSCCKGNMTYVWINADNQKARGALKHGAQDDISIWQWMLPKDILY